MITLNQINIRLGDIVGFRALLETYEDLAAQKMQEIRGEIYGHREYAGVLMLMSRELRDDIVSVVKNKEKQRAALFISSDKGMYGKAFDNLGMRFAQFLKENSIDAYVVGQVGAEMMRAMGVEAKYTEIATDTESVARLWASLGEYQEINIFYLKYDSLAKQSVDIQRISGDLIPREAEKYEYDDKIRLKYIYEPTVAGVVDVFAKEVLVFLSEQTMKESDLAKHAARLMYLDGCLQKNGEDLKETMRQRMVLRKMRANKRQNARMVNYLTRSKTNIYG